ncbi:MAG: hypothetical protein HY677_00335 [Chloroflexi bacterium]|nr:hypothetical protein [Chloroflexota bacterium]
MAQRRNLSDLYYGRRRDFVRPQPRDGWDRFLAMLAYVFPFIVPLILILTSSRRPYRYYHAMQSVFMTLFLWAGIIAVIAFWYGVTAFFYGYTDNSPGSGDILWWLWGFHLVTWYFGWRALRGNTFDALWASTFLERMGWI